MKKDLEMLAEQIEISVKGDQYKYDSINDQRVKLNQRKILFIVNYAMNNASNWFLHLFHISTEKILIKNI